MSITIEQIRNIAIGGHGGTGKTSLVEHLLVTGGVIPKPETVESGKTVSDFTEEEISRKISIHTSVSHIKWEDIKINILDTPGSGDFIGEVVEGFRACESVLLLVAADSGVQIETIKLWRRLNKENKPRFIFINKMDKEHADFNKTIGDIKEKFKVNAVPVVIPMGNGNDFKGVIDIIEQKVYMNTGGKQDIQDIPGNMKDSVEEARMALIEAAAEGNDELMEKYLEEEKLSEEEIKEGLKQGIKKSSIVPVLCGAATLSAGIHSLLNFFINSVPSPGGKTKALKDDDSEVEVAIDADGSCSCFVYKTSIDQFSGKLSYVKVISGTIHPDIELYNTQVNKKEKISKLFVCQGKKLEDTQELIAGDIGILAKLNTVETNHTLCTHDNTIKYLPLKLPQPVHAVAISAKTKKDEDKLNQLLQKTATEDLTFRIDYNKETRENVVSSMGELHLNIILEKIKEKQKMEIETRVPKVAYRETITMPASAEYQHKKQTGGHGQYAKVVLEIRPLERGEHFAFVNAIFGGVVSRGYIPGVEKGVLEGMEEGILAGYPVVDLEARIVDGKEHPVDSSEMSFKLAARGALKAAMEKAKPVLLEPVMNLTVFVDDQYLGDVLSDLSSRRGRVLGQEPIGGGIQEVKAQVPQAELLRYAIDLKAITSGTAAFEIEFSHYNPISGKVADDVIKASQAAKEGGAGSK
ncbi:MAG: elongation factor G [Spirochaetales bacterium]|nr:elongation factor G [Spirochaetales bacterium]